MKTLEDAIRTSANKAAIAEAEAFVKNLSELLTDNYFSSSERVNHVYLNSIREEAARLTAALVTGK